MKRYTLTLSIFAFLLPMTTVNAKAETPIESAYESVKDSSASKTRLSELKSIHKSTLEPHERKELRQEIRQERKNLKEPDTRGGLWISLAPLLVVVALIIILL